MSIELKQTAQQAVDAFDAFGDADDFASLFELTQKIRALRTAIQQEEAQQPSSKEHLFELWWEAHMPNATQEQAWTAFTAAVASNGVGIAAQQPATGEPVGYMNEGHIHELAMRRLPYGYVYPEAGAGASTAVYTRPAPSVPDDVVRDAERWRTFLATRPSNTHEVVNDAIDAAMLTASPTQKGGE